MQLIAGELPCPLCVVQRICLMLCALGPLYILRQANDGALTYRAVAIGNGIAIIAALVGAVVSTRQVLLHILPGDQGFGSPLFGLHLYTWSLIAFVCQAAASSPMLIAAAWLKEEPDLLADRECHGHCLRRYRVRKSAVGDCGSRLQLGSAV